MSNKPLKKRLRKQTTSISKTNIKINTKTKPLLSKSPTTSTIKSKHKLSVSNNNNNNNNNKTKEDNIRLLHQNNNNNNHNDNIILPHQNNLNNNNNNNDMKENDNNNVISLTNVNKKKRPMSNDDAQRPKKLETVIHDLSSLTNLFQTSFDIRGVIEKCRTTTAWNNYLVVLSLDNCFISGWLHQKCELGFEYLFQNVLLRYTPADKVYYSTQKSFTTGINTKVIKIKKKENYILNKNEPYQDMVIEIKNITAESERFMKFSSANSIFTYWYSNGIMEGMEPGSKYIARDCKTLNTNTYSICGRLIHIDDEIFDKLNEYTNKLLRLIAIRPVTFTKPISIECTFDDDEKYRINLDLLLSLVDIDINIANKSTQELIQILSMQVQRKIWVSLTIGADGEIKDISNYSFN